MADQAERPKNIPHSPQKLIEVVIQVALKAGMTKMRIRDHVERVLSKGGVAAITTYSRTAERHSEPEPSEAKDD